MTRPIELTIPLKIESEMNTSSGSRFAKYQRFKKQKQTVAFALSLHRQELADLVLRNIVVTLTRIGPRDLDGDNLQSGFKGVRDCVADALGRNDNDPSIEWLYGQRRGRPREYAFTVTIAAGTARTSAAPVKRGVRR